MPDSDAKPDGTFLTEDQWRDAAKGMIKAELARQNLTYGDLAALLGAMGVDETEISIRNKLSRGAFPFVFALQTMEALGLEFFIVRKRTESIGLPESTHKFAPGELAAIMKAVRGK
jgi:hypothetical protein